MFITRDEAIRMIENDKSGKFYRVTFVKKNGDVRKMVTRNGVTKGITGEGARWNPASRGMKFAYDMVKRAWRTINFATMTELKMFGITYKIKES